MRPHPPSVPALSETVEYVSAVETQRGLMPTLDPARFVRVYCGNLAHLSLIHISEPTRLALI
eukprot:14462258-Alexandrium_andersonii.AAC.1